jgi:hypothetical protein
MVTRRKIAVIKRKCGPEDELESLLRRISELTRLKRPELVKKTSAA